MTSITNVVETKQHFIGKLCIFSDEYSYAKIACLVHWIDGIPFIFQIDMKTLKMLFSPKLFEKAHENVFVMECDANVDENNALQNIEITNIFERYNPIRQL